MKYTHRELHEAVRALEKSYRDTLELTTADTVAHFLKAVGEDLGKTTVAILIKRNAWDGRISRRSASWAESFTGEDSEIITTIHKAHLEQIAQAIRQ